MENNYKGWLHNTLTSETNEWKSTVEPSADSLARCASPVIIFQMIDQNLQVSRTIR